MSYTDALDISFQERVYLIEFINNKLDETQKATDKKIAEMKAKKKVK